MLFEWIFLLRRSYRLRIRAYLAGTGTKRRIRDDYFLVADTFELENYPTYERYSFSAAFEVKYELDEVLLQDVFTFRASLAQTLNLSDQVSIYVKAYLDHTDKEPYLIEYFSL